MITSFCHGKYTSFNFEQKNQSKSNIFMVSILKIVFLCVNKHSKGKSEMTSLMDIKKKGKIFVTISRHI